MYYFSMEVLCGSDVELPEKLRNLVLLNTYISNEILMDKDPNNVCWDDIGSIYIKNIWPSTSPAGLSL